LEEATNGCVDFFPNSDTNKARKMRIEKAKEYGATWVKDWNPGITHVIMDDNMTYQDLAKYVKLEQVHVRPPVAVIACMALIFRSAARDHRRQPDLPFGLHNVSRTNQPRSRIIQSFGNT
jgi:hypothetical protein